MPVDAVEEFEVDVVDRVAGRVAVDEIKWCTADALNRRQAQFHRTRGNLDRLCAKLQRAVVGEVRVLDAERHACRAGAVLLREVGRVAFRFLVEDEVDAALAVKRDLLGTVPRDGLEAQRVEHGLEHARLRRSKFDEFEAVEAHRVFEQVRHGCLLLIVTSGDPTFCAISAHYVP